MFLKRTSLLLLLACTPPEWQSEATTDFELRTGDVRLFRIDVPDAFVDEAESVRVEFTAQFDEFVRRSTATVSLEGGDTISESADAPDRIVATRVWNPSLPCEALPCSFEVMVALDTSTDADATPVDSTCTLHIRVRGRGDTNPPRGRITVEEL